MTGTGLEERLARLAEADVVAATPVPEQLWTRGRRWQRRRRLVGVVTAACLTLCAAGLVAASLPLLGVGRDVTVAASSDVAPQLPDRLYAPSKWLGTLRDTPLVAVTEAERGGWTGGGTGVVGVSAVSGEYGFLDLPDRASGAALSPDGEWLAYWLAGTPSGDANTQFGQESPTTGVAVRHLRTGEERRHEVETEHGLRAEQLFWLDGTTLVFKYGQLVVGDSGPLGQQGASRRHGGWWWQVDSGGPARWPWGGEEVPDVGFWAARDGWVLGVGEPEGALVLLNPETRARTVVRGESGATQSSGRTTAYGPDGRVAILDVGDDGSARTAEIRLGRLEPGDDELVEREVLRHRAGTSSLLGWRDGDLLVSMRSDRDEVEEGTTLDVMVLDPASEEQSVLVKDVWSPYGGWDLADGLLETAEVVDAVEPPSPWDPRWVAAAWTLAAAAVLVALGVWRRRGRP